MYKLIFSARGCDDLSIGFHRNRDTRQRELTNNKKIKGKYLFTIYIKIIFGFAVYQEKATNGLGYKLTLTRNTDNAVLNKDNVTVFGNIKINAIDWYVSHYTPSLAQYRVLLKQILDETPSQL